MYSSIKPVPFAQATGSVSYNMTNDCLFHIVLQKNKKALIGLIASLLHLDPESILDAVVQNPIEIGNIITSKTEYLDILVLFNNDTTINLEMQVKDLHNWVPRSLSYLCREFDRLDHGDDYNDAKPAYHIGFLDYTLFPEHPEFYATFRICNLKSGHVYSDRFTLSVVELNHIDMATEEDRAYGIDKWAALFKATTWEEVKMLAQTNPYIESAAESMYRSVTDPKILDILRVRQEEIRGEIHRRERLAEQDKQIADLSALVTEKEQQIDHINALYSWLFKNNRIEDAQKATTDPEYRAMLLKEFDEVSSSAEKSPDQPA